VYVHFPYGSFERRDAVANNLGLHCISGPGVDEEDHVLATRNGDSERLWEFTVKKFPKPVLLFTDLDRSGGMSVSVEACQCLWRLLGTSNSPLTLFDLPVRPETN
jgi:hypothetical protein